MTVAGSIDLLIKRIEELEARVAQLEQDSDKNTGLDRTAKIINPKS